MKYLLIILFIFSTFYLSIKKEESYSYSFNSNCRFLIQANAPAQAVPMEMVCKWETADQLRWLLVSSKQPSLLVVAHGHETDQWYLQAKVDNIAVSELTAYYDGIIGVFACRTWDATDPNLVWEGKDLMPFENDLKVQQFTLPYHTLFSDHLLGGYEMAKYFK